MIEQVKVNPEKIDTYIMQNNKYFPSEKIFVIKEKLLNLSENKFQSLYALELKDPTMILIVSIFGGALGIDRFMIGDTSMGVLKLLTCGFCGILTILDWFTIAKKTKEVNFNKIMTFL